MAQDGTRKEGSSKPDAQAVATGRELVTSIHENVQEESRPTFGQWETLGSGSRSAWRILWIALLVTTGLLLASLVVYLAATRAPIIRTGTVESIKQGALQIAHEEEGSWHPLEEGQTIPQGARIRSTTATWATIAFPVQSLMRIEAPGGWKMAELVGKGRRLRITIEQKEGRASFVSPPPRSFDRSRFQIQVAGVTAELLGVGTFITAKDQATQVRVLQGYCTLRSSGSATKMVAGEMATIDPDGTITVTRSE
jgi:ferric-dicitrate binding protein FerR (iron transport regulator)